MEKFGSFILGDGTGAGKTMIELAVAEHYAKNGKSVLIVTQGESVYNDAFVRDAKLLAGAGSDFWKNRLIFLNSGSTKIDDKHFEETGQTRITSNRGTFQEGKINVISYDYLSLGSESILDKLKLDKYPDIVIFDECHNLRNIHENPGAIVRGKEYERTPKGKRASWP